MHTRSYRHLSAEERETVSLGLAHGFSIRAMAQILGRAPSTVSGDNNFDAGFGSVGVVSSPVPEPATVLLLAAGLVGVGVWRSRIGTGAA